MTRLARWLALGGVAAAAGAAAALQPVTSLELVNTTQGRTATFPLPRGETFSVTSMHSMYGAPVTEELSVDGEGRIVLQAVSSPSAAVREYFGLTAAGERHEVRRVLGEVVFRVAAGEAQRLRVGGAERSFLALGDHGDRLVLRAARAPALARLFSTRVANAP